MSIDCHWQCGATYRPNNIKLKILNRKFPTTQDQDAKKWSCPFVSGPSSQGPDIALSRIMTRAYLQGSTGLSQGCMAVLVLSLPLLFLCTRFLECVYFFLARKNISKIFVQGPDLVMCLQILHNFVFFFGKYAVFFFGFLKSV